MQESEDQKKIVALTAQVQSWEKVKANLGSKKPDFKKGNNKKGKKGKGKGNNKPKPQEPAWVTVAPGPANLKIRMLTERIGIGASTMANMASECVTLATSARSRKPLKARPTVPRPSDMPLVATTSLAR
jgi:hypothetical protein